MAEPLVSDALWTLIAPLLPKRRPRPKGGRPPLDDRKALEGIVFVLRTGIPWASLPQELGFGSGMTCWRRLRDWQAGGVFERLHRALLDRLGRANAIDFGRCSLDSASFPAKRGASASARARPTAASQAPSATSSWTRTVSRSRSCSAPRTSRSPQVGGRAHAGLVRPLPPAHRALRAAARHPARLPPARRGSDLPQV